MTGEEVDMNLDAMEWVFAFFIKTFATLLEKMIVHLNNYVMNSDSYK